MFLNGTSTTTTTATTATTTTTTTTTDYYNNKFHGLEFCHHIVAGTLYKNLNLNCCTARCRRLLIIGVDGTSITPQHFEDCNAHWLSTVNMHFS